MKRRKLKGMVLSIMGALRGPGSTLALKLVHRAPCALATDVNFLMAASVANAQGAR